MKKLHEVCSRMTPRMKECILPALRIKLTRPGAAGIPAGNSRVGGHPTVPADFVWPRVEDRSLAFVAQIDLAEAHSAGGNLGLPSTGHLYFFFDHKGWVSEKFSSARVIHLECTMDGLVPLPTPDDVPAHYRFPQSVVSFTPMPQLHWMLLTCGDEFMDTFTDEERALRDEYQQARREEDEAPHHHLGGICYGLDGGMEGGMEILTLRRSGRRGRDWPDTESDEFAQSVLKKWRNLLQIDTDRGAEIMWGDMGTLFFCMQTQHWIEGNFSKVEAEEECN